MSTSPIITFGTYNALGYKQEGTLALSVAQQSFSKINDLKLHNAASNTYPYATYEPDMWLLDGSYKFKPAADADVHIGIMGTVLSGSDGVFASPPILTLTLTTERNTDGITLYFDANSNDFANSITVKFYDDANVLIRTDDYAPNVPTFSTNQEVLGFKKITITFNSTNKPYRYLRLLDFDYVNATYFSGTEIQSVLVIEEIDPISIELPFNTLEFKLFTSNPEFSIIEPSGGYTLLRYRHPVHCYEMVDGVLVFIGKFFLDEWSNKTEMEIEIKAVDAIGLLDQTQLYGFVIRYGYPVQLHIILQSASWSNFSSLGIQLNIDADLIATYLSGWCPTTTYREFLQQLAFASGAYITCSRSGDIEFRKFELVADVSTYDHTILKADKGGQQLLSLLPLVTGVELTSHDYEFAGTSIEVFNRSMPAGTHTVLFNAPMNNANMSLSAGATLISSSANHITFSIPSTQTVVISIEEYKEVKNIYAVNLTEIDPADPPAMSSGTVQNLLRFNGVDASTTFTDEAGLTWTAAGNAQLDSSYKKFGFSSGLFDGTGDWISTTEQDIFASGDFTLDFWIRPSNVASLHNILGVAGIRISMNSGVYVEALVSQASTLSVKNYTTFVVNTWYHLALVRHNGVLTFYVNGIAGTGVAITGAVTNLGTEFYIGRWNTSTSTPYAGHIDAIEVVTGVALWTSNFTPPMSPTVPVGNVIKIDDPWFVNVDGLAVATQRVYDYFQQRYLQKAKLFSPAAAPGDSVKIDTLYDRQMGGIVERMRLDLSGGFTANIEIVGEVIAL